MCLSKVANPRDTGEYVRLPATDEGGLTRQQAQLRGEMHQLADPILSPEAAAAPVFSGYSQSREMSAMVSALTHVVSGQRSADCGYYGYRPHHLSGAATSSIVGGSAVHSSNSPSSAYSSSSSGSWAGQKRGREEESVTQLSDQLQRVYNRAYNTDLRSSHGESSSITTGN